MEVLLHRAYFYRPNNSHMFYINRNTSDTNITGVLTRKPANKLSFFTSKSQLSEHYTHQFQPLF